MSAIPRFKTGDRVQLHVPEAVVVQDHTVANALGDERTLVLHFGDETIVARIEISDDVEGHPLEIRLTCPAQWPPQNGDVWQIGGRTWFIYPAPDAPSPRLSSGPPLCARSDRGEFIDTCGDFAGELLKRAIGKAPTLLVRDGREASS